MMTDKEYALEMYIGDLEQAYSKMKHYAKYLNFHGDDEEYMDAAMDEMKKLIKDLKKCKSVKEAKELVKIGKLVDKYNN